MVYQEARSLLLIMRKQETKIFLSLKFDDVIIMTVYCKNCGEDLTEWYILNNIAPDSIGINCPNCGTYID